MRERSSCTCMCVCQFELHAQVVEQAKTATKSTFLKSGDHVMDFILHSCLLSTEEELKKGKYTINPSGVT